MKRSADSDASISARYELINLIFPKFGLYL